MPEITFEMTDGTTRTFPHKGSAQRPGTKRVRYEGGFAVVTDQHGSETAIPAGLIREVRMNPGY